MLCLSVEHVKHSHTDTTSTPDWGHNLSWNARPCTPRRVQLNINQRSGFVCSFKCKYETLDASLSKRWSGVWCSIALCVSRTTVTGLVIVGGKIIILVASVVLMTFFRWVLNGQHPSGSLIMTAVHFVRYKWPVSANSSPEPCSVPQTHLLLIFSRAAHMLCSLLAFLRMGRQSALLFHLLSFCVSCAYLSVWETSSIQSCSWTAFQFHSFRLLISPQRLQLLQYTFRGWHDC